MEKMTYEDRVRQMSCDLAAEMYFKNEYGKWPYYNIHYASLNLNEKRSREEKVLPAARLAVAKMAEAVRFFLDPTSQLQHGEVNRLLIKYGLIPDTTAPAPASGETT